MESWVVVNIMVTFWVPIIIRHLLFGDPKRDPNFDNYPVMLLNLNTGCRRSMFP